MAVIVITEVPGAGTDMADAMRQAGGVERLKAAPGFREHWSGTTDTGYRVIELWESRQDSQAWFEGTIKPNLPPGANPSEPTFTDLYLQIQPD